MQMNTICIETAQGSSWVIDNAFDNDTLASIDRFRVSLKLDSKRPTVDRRFFADAASITSFFVDDEDEKKSSTIYSDKNIDEERPLASRIEDAITRSNMILQSDDDDSSDNKKLLSQSQSASSQLTEKKKKVHVLRYQRFLEYTKSGSGLDPHTDGTKVCCDHPGNYYTSTHTMLLYLTDCQNGGETCLLSDCSSPISSNDDKNSSTATKTSSSSLIYSCVPKRGRLLLFPHATPHAGMPVIDLPKICLRAEVCLQSVGNNVTNQKRH